VNVVFFFEGVVAQFPVSTAYGAPLLEEAFVEDPP
jgi:hypothetical protein